MFAHPESCSVQMIVGLEITVHLYKLDSNVERMKNEQDKNSIFISWAPYCSRSDTLAARFGADSIKIHYFSFKKPWLAPLKYFLQAIKTLSVLFSRKPDRVFVMNPPIFCVLTVYLYCALTNTPYILDSHTGVFFERKWTIFNGLHSFLARKAQVSIVTNEFLGEKVERWGGEYFIIPDVPVEFANPQMISLPDPHITIVNTFSYDEPVENVLKMAAQMPEVQFSMTGSLKHCSKEFHDMKPDNLRFTGFLSDEDYKNTLYSSNAVLVLTLEDHTMQRGAYEAMSLEVPIVTSDWELLRDTFFRGAAYVDNSVEGIAAGIREVLDNQAHYRQEVKELKKVRRQIWSTNEVRFKELYLGEVPAMV